MLYRTRFLRFYGPYCLVNLVVYIIIVWRGVDFHTYFSYKNGIVLGILGIGFYVGCIIFVVKDVTDKEHASVRE